MQIDALLFEKIQIQDSESHLESYGLYVGNRSRETLKIFKAKTSQERRTLTYSKKTFRQLQGKLKRCQIGDCPRNNPILIRNDIPENRFFCGRKVLGNGGISIFESFPQRCLESQSYLFSAKPPTFSGNDGMRPIELYWDFNALGISTDNDLKTVEFPCNIPCRINRDDDFQSVMPLISVKDTNWEILSSMEGEEYYHEAKYNPNAYRKDRYYALTSFKSEIPMPYFSFSEYRINNPAVDFDEVIKAASWLSNNCESKSNREELVKALQNSPLRVDSLSGCLNNAEPPPKVDLSNATAVQEKYLFYLAFENQKSEDYVTEKLWGALRAGTLPVYYGAPNIRDHVPRKSVIFVDDYNSPQELADYLVRLTTDKSLYESYHSWRQNPLDGAFVSKYSFTKTHSICRMCNWAYAKKYGFYFNHSSQQVQQLRFSRSTCRNKMGLVGYPFKEFWLSNTTGKAVHVQSTGDAKTCNLDNSNRVLSVGHGGIKRKVFDQDGVTHFSIDGNDEVGYVLQLETKISSKNNLIQVDDREYWLQDPAARLTLLTNKPVVVSLSAQGTLQLAIHPPLRIRIIVESIDNFHAGAQTRPNYFGQIMTNDFFWPLQAYQILG